MTYQTILGALKAAERQARYGNFSMVVNWLDCAITINRERPWCTCWRAEHWMDSDCYMDHLDNRLYEDHFALPVVDLPRAAV